MKYFSEEEVKKILYDIDYNWKSLPQCLYDYKHIELSESKWNTGETANDIKQKIKKQKEIK